MTKPATLWVRLRAWKPWRPLLSRLLQSRLLRSRRQRVTAGVIVVAVLAAGGVQGYERFNKKKAGYRFIYQRPYPAMTLSAAKLGMPEELIQNANYMLANWVPLKNGTRWAREKGTDAQAQLGRLLFHEKRLSRNHDIACNSCHNLRAYGMDRQKVSFGHAGQLGRRNAPTVYNAAANVAQFWDGRAGTVEEQAQRPILEPTEMAMGDEQRVLDTLNSIPQYRALFREAFPDEPIPVSMTTVGQAIGAFERRLFISSPWDDFLEGNDNAVSDEAKRGFALFSNIGCVSCHAGALVGSGSLEKLGAVKPWPNQQDQGRFETTGQEFDRMRFKVPSLRNAAKTFPYFHDASSETLEDAITRMAWHQTGRKLSGEPIVRIAAFLRSLTGRLPEALVEPPALPPSGSATPPPDPSPVAEPGDAPPPKLPNTNRATGEREPTTQSR